MKLKNNTVQINYYINTHLSTKSILFLAKLNTSSTYVWWCVASNYNYIMLICRYIHISKTPIAVRFPIDIKVVSRYSKVSLLLDVAIFSAAFLEYGGVSVRVSKIVRNRYGIGMENMN